MNLGKQIRWICSSLQPILGCHQSKTVIFYWRAVVQIPSKAVMHVSSIKTLYGQNWLDICVIACTMQVGRRVFVIWSLATWIWWAGCAKECNWDDVPRKWMSFPSSPISSYFSKVELFWDNQNLHHHHAVQGGPAVHHHWSIVQKLWRLQVK